MKLHENTLRELTITHKGNEIIVKTKKDIASDKVRKEQNRFLIESLSLLASGIVLGACITYLILN